MKRKTRAVWWMALALLVISTTAWGIACGTQGDIIGGVTSWPYSGVKPWAKIDLDPDQGGLQPFIFISNGDFDYIEPSLVKAHGYFWVFFERRFWRMVDGIKVPTGSDILVGRSTDTLTYEWVNDGKPVLRADQHWETGCVGAPTVRAKGDGFEMWYAGGVGAGIGFATSDDGIAWTKHDGPVVTGDQNWEDGFVGAPAVVRFAGRFRMYYSGGFARQTEFSQFAGRFIGYADSENGVTWTKRDAHGRNSKDDPGDVFYILGPTQPWQGYDPQDPYAGAVASPSPLFTRPVDRNLLLLYYTGNPVGDPVNSETSVGVAGAYDEMIDIEDGAEFEVNPVLSERFALTLDGVSQYLAYSESTPSVIRTEFDQYFMAFSQTDPLSELTGGKQGIAMAACPRY
ncbi:MAG: hypothetical protein IT350_20115 [Deltaproteobacteria bacterium]|nr:hypothetical protein [Deltaproteobacteria bacterium]